jgi:purine-nucleoside phosphorylase
MVEKALKSVRQALDTQPEIGLILGSGLGELADEIESPVVVPYEQIEGFPVSTVAGHDGCFVGGVLEGKRVLAMKGRVHYYEGYSMKQVVMPIYLMKELGIHTVVVTNAAGGINRSFQPGDLMVIRDHLNLTGDNPLIGPNDERYGPRFPDMSQAYDEEYRKLARRAAELVNQELLAEAESAGEKAQSERTTESFTGRLRLQEGVYAGIAGPNYMTPSELIMLARLGADALGMSTVPEVIAARHAGLRVLGISCITDMAIGEELEPLTHEQVVSVANRTKPLFKRLIRTWLSLLET